MGTLKVTAKCSDMCYIKYYGKSGKILAENDSYVPKGITIGGKDDDGDYIDIEIDTETGMILNWKPVNDRQMVKAIKTA